MRGNGPVLVCEGLRKSFDDLVAVDDVGFAIAEGETFGLLGPNGAGKTTSISIIAGILEGDSGTVSVNGEPITTTTARARGAIGYVPQELALYPDLTAEENLHFFGRLYGLVRQERSARVGEVLDVIGLADRAGDRADTYSGGMKRRLNIGIGLLHRPQLLILDEPTVGVDPQSRNAILESVEALSRQGMAVLYTTHYMEEAERLCDRVAIIDSGKIQAEGTRRELVELVGEQDRIRLDVVGNAADIASRIGDESIHASAKDGAIELLLADARSRLPEILAVAAEGGASVTGVEVTEPNLEAVFLHLTGKALRD